MSYNDIADMFSEYTKSGTKNCEHLKELFLQAALQINEEEGLVIENIPRKQKRKSINEQL